jgi:membrane fusion protein, heavy metal efflux system
MSRMLLAVFMVGCQRSSAPVPTALAALDAHHDETEHEGLPRQVRLSPAVVLEAGLEVAPATLDVLTATMRLPGEVTAEPDRTARLSAAASGRLEQVTFNEGARVSKGQVMAHLRVPDIGRLRGVLAATTAKAKAARANVERLRLLKADGFGAEQTVVDAQADAEAYEAEARALSQQLGALGAAAGASGYLISLRAPIAGVVVARDAVVGQPIGVDHVLATIVDLSSVWFLGRVFEKDLGRLQPQARCTVQLNAFPDERFEGVVEYVGQQTDPVARTLTARIRLKNESNRLRLGLFGTAQVEVTEPSKATPRVTVLRSAVTEIGDRHVVFVRAQDGDFVVHEVTLGESALAQVQVLSGLDEGEQVVTRGVFTLKSLLLKSTLAEDEH